MSLGIKRKKTAVAEPKIHFSWKEAKRQKSLLIWSGIIVIYGIIFYYLPLGGWLMAFQNYRPIDGLFHSEFVGLQKFQQLFFRCDFFTGNTKYTCNGCDQFGGYFRCCNCICSPSQ